MCYNTPKKGGTTMFTKENAPHSCNRTGITALILSLSLILLCGFLFLYHYGKAYSTASDWFISRRACVFVFHIAVALAAVGVSILLKLLLKSRIVLVILLVVSICLPLLCYVVNYFMLKKNGPLYFLVEEGGAFQFITLHDFDRDGVNDAYDYTGDDIREISGGPIYNLDPQGTIQHFEYTVVGKGGNLGYAGCELNYTGKQISIRMNRSRVTYEQITIILHLQDSVTADQITLTQGGSPLEKTVIDEHTVSVTFDAATCAAWQEAAMNESFRMLVRYEVKN